MSLLSHALNVSSLLAAAGLTFFFLRYLYRLLFSPLRAIPGPLYTRFTSARYKYHSIKGERVDYIHSLHQKYGRVVRVNPSEVSILDLSALSEIYRVSTPFHKSTWYYELTARQAPNIFSFIDPHAHRARRSLLASAMSETGLKKVEPIVNANIIKTIDGMAAEFSQEGAVDVFKWFTYMATDIIGELTFSESFRMLDQVKPNQYYYDLKHLQQLSQFRVELGDIVYLLGKLGIQPFAESVAMTVRIRNYAEQSVARYEKHVEANPTDPTPTLFTKLFTKEEEGSLSRLDIIRDGTSYIVAGSDTTATTATYLVYTIYQMPEILAKLQADIIDVPESFDWEDVRHLPYLNNVITETLRLFPAVSGSLKRDVPAMGAHLAGYHFPAGTVVATQAYSLHRDPNIWTDPEVFNPDRWLDPTPEMNQAFMAFGGGTRICIGMHLARDELRFAITKFLRAFPKAKILESPEAMHQDAYFLMGPKGNRCMVDLGISKKA